MLSRLTGGLIQPNPDDAGAIEISTQVETGQGRPDLEISGPYQLVWVEVKAESELRTGQLEGYRVLLGERKVEQTRLILLTRYPEVIQSNDARPDLELRWFEIADWLEMELPETEAAGEVAGFLVRQFLDFLKERNMTLTQVGPNMPEGLRSVGSLLNMLFEAAAACRVAVKKQASWECVGINIDGIQILGWR